MPLFSRVRRRGAFAQGGGLGARTGLLHFARQAYSALAEGARNRVRRGDSSRKRRGAAVRQGRVRRRLHGADRCRDRAAFVVCEARREACRVLYGVSRPCGSYGRQGVGLQDCPLSRRMEQDGFRHVFDTRLPQGHTPDVERPAARRSGQGARLRHGELDGPKRQAKRRCGVD